MPTIPLNYNFIINAAGEAVQMLDSSSIVAQSTTITNSDLSVGIPTTGHISMPDSNVPYGYVPYGYGTSDINFPALQEMRIYQHQLALQREIDLTMLADMNKVMADKSTITFEQIDNKVIARDSSTGCSITRILSDPSEYNPITNNIPDLYLKFLKEKMTEELQAEAIRQDELKTKLIDEEIRLIEL